MNPNIILIMKNNILLSIVSVAAILLPSCNKTPLKTFHLTGAPELELTYEGGYASFGIEANENDSWSVSTDVDWLEIQHTFGPGDNTSGHDDAVLMFYAGRWTMNTARVAHVQVEGPGEVYSKTITQRPKPLPDSPIDLMMVLTNQAGEEELELPAGYWVRAECKAAWLTIQKCEEGLLRVKAEQNEGAARSATVKILLSDDALLGTVTVTQKE